MAFTLAVSLSEPLEGVYEVRDFHWPFTLVEARNANKNRFETANSNILYTSVNGGVALGEGEASAIAAVLRERAWAATAAASCILSRRRGRVATTIVPSSPGEGGGPQCNR